MNEDKKLDILKKEMSKSKKESMNLDTELVDNIVSKMKKKDKDITPELASESRIKELRDIIAEGKLTKLDIDTEAKLVGFSDSNLEKSVARYYKPFKRFIDFIIKIIIQSKIGKEIAKDLYSANIKKSIIQHLILSIIYSIFLSFFITFLLSILLFFILPSLLLLTPFILVFSFIFFVIFLSYMVPKQKAKTRASLIDAELIYALRHLATELQAGMGLYKTLQSIAANDYGVLSEELSRTILEIENGIDTKTALRHTALRCQSKNFNIAIFHIIRTLNTGGNLSQSINSVADNVSFELLESAKIFGEKMNFFGIIFIFSAIVLPVFASILAAIANAPISADGGAFLGGVFTPTMLYLLYLVLMPVIFVGLIYFIRAMAPKT